MERCEQCLNGSITLSISGYEVESESYASCPHKASVPRPDLVLGLEVVTENAPDTTTTKDEQAIIASLLSS